MTFRFSFFVEGPNLLMRTFGALDGKGGFGSHKNRGRMNKGALPDLEAASFNKDSQDNDDMTEPEHIRTSFPETWLWTDTKTEYI